MATVHRNLTGADLHEPKGADTALSGQVYVSNGVGSGSWTDASSIIANSAWDSGDTKITFRTTAPTGWILFSEGGTIGDGSSSATVRANADTLDLFTVFWNAYNNTICPVSGGRGASAAADFAAHKRLQLPPCGSRGLGVAGSGSGLTSRTLGATAGAETVVLVTANLPPYTPAGTIANGAITITHNAAVNSGGSSTGGGGFSINPVGAATISASQATSTFTGTAQGGTSTAVATMSPMIFLNLLIKL